MKQSKPMSGLADQELPRLGPVIRPTSRSAQDGVGRHTPVGTWGTECGACGRVPAAPANGPRNQMSMGSTRILNRVASHPQHNASPSPSHHSGGRSVGRQEASTSSSHNGDRLPCPLAIACLGSIVDYTVSLGWMPCTKQPHRNEPAAALANPIDSRTGAGRQSRPKSRKVGRVIDVAGLP